MTTYEQVVDEFIPALPRNLPNRILRAIDNALHLGGLSRSVRTTLADIARFVPQARPFETVFAHKTKIAERTGTSERTVYRHLNALKEAGLVEILVQERKSRNGRFAVSRLRLTQRAADLLGFIPREEKPFFSEAAITTACPSSLPEKLPANSVSPAQFSCMVPATKSDQHQVIHTPPTAILAAGHTLTVPTVPKNHPHQQIKNGLPGDLTWLTGNGLSRAGIFKLMGLAKINRQRLSDIVLVVQKHLANMRGGRLFAYLATLCRSKTDFTYTARQQQQRMDQEKQAVVFKRKCTLFRERFKNTAFTNRQQTTLYLIDSQARFAQIISPQRTSTMPLTNLSEFIEAVETGQLILATFEIEKRLSGKEG